MQRRVAEEELDAEDLQIYYSEAKGAESKLKCLEIDEFGQIDSWPSNFMGDAFGETLSAERARLERMRDQ